MRNKLPDRPDYFRHGGSPTLRQRRLRTVNHKHLARRGTEEEPQRMPLLVKQYGLLLQYPKE